jgi:hypothetical protein
MPYKRSDVRLASSILRDLPVRRGPRPKTVRGPFHIQCDGHGDPKYISQLVKDVLCWPQVETLSTADPTATIPIRFQKGTVTLDSVRFIGEREFARVLLGAATIYVVLPLVCAHRAIVRGWAELHYSVSFGLMPVGTVLLYTPKNAQELSICFALFSAAYYSAVSANHLVATAPPEMSTQPTGHASSFSKTLN